MSGEKLMDWQRLRRFFEITGKLPGIHYKARIAVFELQDAAEAELDQPSIAADEPKLLNDISNLRDT